MDLNRPFAVITPTLDGVVLQVLAGRELNDARSVAEIHLDARTGCKVDVRTGSPAGWDRERAAREPAGRPAGEWTH